MSHHHKKNREPIQQNPSPNFDLSGMLSGMLRNLDINQVIGLLSNLAASPLMKSNGLNIGQLASLFSNKGTSTFQGSANSAGASSSGNTSNASNTINIDREKLNQVIMNLMSTMNTMASGMTGATTSSSPPKEQES